jgi:hypothetical protein
MPEELIPVLEDDETVNDEILKLRATGLTTRQISRQLLIPEQEVHKRLDAVLPLVDAQYRKREIALSLVQIDTVIGAHLPLVKDPESGSLVIRGVCEKRALLGLSGSNYDPIQLLAVADPRKQSGTPAAYEQVLQRLGKLPSSEPEPASE